MFNVTPSLEQYTTAWKRARRSDPGTNEERNALRREDPDCLETRSLVLMHLEEIMVGLGATLNQDKRVRFIELIKADETFLTLRGTSRRHALFPTALPPNSSAV